MFPDQDVVLGREMTKIYEEFIRGKVEDILEKFATLKIKGEFSVAINNRQK